MENDRSYFTRRALEERSAAEKADDPKARDAHQQLAESYEERAHTAATDPDVAAESYEEGAQTATIE